MPSFLTRGVLRPAELAVRGLYQALGGFRVEGVENIPPTGGVILAPNHLSWADPPAIYMATRRKCWFMANEFLFRIPVLGKLIPIVGAFPVHRGRVDRDAIRIAEQHLKEQDLLCVFPEGGTTITGTLYPFESGVALLSLRTGAPIVPVGITGTDKLLPMQPPHRLHYVRGGVRVRFGKPIHPDEVDPALPRKERMEALTQRLYLAVAALLPPEYLPAELHAPGGPVGAAGMGTGE
ncbi:MAG: 1-acyl-sn-glycerol-3-phosphate acyltransferase [Armatimonadetes bacterium]|jgi:1-acyl-sn-glycerol-3-phosphate acyltransferase|nr:1-acyl-sn-glycerol-3-phosphate acyltransferase [Armatimonadota bacterium]